MIKILELEECYDCPNYDKDFSVCNELNVYSNPNTILINCPLPTKEDYIESEFNPDE